MYTLCLWMQISGRNISKCVPLICIYFCWCFGELVTYLRWDTLIISMGGSSFPRSPLNAKHLPGKHNKHTEREKVRGWRRGGDNRRQKMVSFLIPVKKLIHLIFFLVPVHPGFISFVRARRESCTQLILTICSNPCLTLTTFRSRNSTLCRASKWPCEQNKNALQVHCITFANGSAYQISRRALRKSGLIEMCKW